MVLPARFPAILFLTPLAAWIGASPMLPLKDDFPKTMETARHHYEEELPLKDWAKGPVEYLMLNHELDTWKGLETDELRRDFIEWFWSRRDLDSRDEGHPFQEEFYRRVGTANQRFRGFPRGWRSDRGRVWIILGRPNGGQRRRQLRGFGRCSAPEGEWWTYRTNNMAFRAQMGEFHVIFVETRIGQYEICDPSMLGVGAIPPDLQTAFLYTNESAVIDTVSEFVPGAGVVRNTVSIRDTVARMEPLIVPAETWGISGVAGTVLIPIEIPLRDLLFEPAAEGLSAKLKVDVSLRGVDASEELRGSEEWSIELAAADAPHIGGASLRTALLMRAASGGYSVSVRVLDPLSGTAFSWEGEVEISDNGSAISPLVIGRSVTRLRDGGGVGVIAGAELRLGAGETFNALSWLRGGVPETTTVRLTLLDLTGNEVEVESASVIWGSATDAGPLILRATVPPVSDGEYILRLGVGSASVEARIHVE